MAAKEHAGTMEHPLAVIEIRSLDGEGHVRLQCTEVMRAPFPSLAFSVELLQQPFTGANPAIWIEESYLTEFIGQLDRLDRNRDEDAVLSALSPGEFELCIRPIDRIGHLLVTASVARVRYIAGNLICVTDSATVNFELDSSMLKDVLESFRRIAALLA